MTEIYTTISEQLKNDAAAAWRLASTLSPVRASSFLNAFTQCAHSEEEQDFLNFYFNLEMEKIKNG